MIKNNNRFSKVNYGSRKTYAIESAILEKWLTADNSLLLDNLISYHLINLQAYYDRKLAKVEGILEESAGRERKVLKLISRVILNWNHYVSTLFEISRLYYGSEDNHLTGTGQGNGFLGDTCRDILCLIMKQIENKN